MLVETKRRLGVEELTGLADGGYYESTGLKECEEEGITVYVPVPDKSAGIRTGGATAWMNSLMTPKETVIIVLRESD